MDLLLTKVEWSLKTLSKTWKEENQGFLIEFQNIEIETNIKAEREADEKGEEEDLPMIQFLLKLYETIFELSKGLPSKHTTNQHRRKEEID